MALGGATFGARYAILVFLVAWPLPQSLGAEGDKMPSITLPTPLQPYSDEGRVTTAGAGVMGLVGTARFEDPAADSLLGKSPCNVPEILAFYRGMTLMQAAYFIFINKVERGFESVDSPHAALDHFPLGMGHHA
jgi:hypothetical protein